MSDALSCDVLVLGAGIAGLTAAEHARRSSPTAKIIVVSKEGLPYYRLNLTRFLAGEVDQDSLVIRPLQWFVENKIDRRRSTDHYLGKAHIYPFSDSMLIKKIRYLLKVFS